MFLRIEELDITDVRCFDKLHLKFSDGINVITGPNGAGKSTILTSIGYGLFGADYLIKMPINTPDLIKRGKNKARISLKFSTPKGKYICKHIIYMDKSNSWKVYKDGINKALAEKPRESKYVVHDILGNTIDHTIFKNALCSRQGELSFLLDINASERQKQINRILGLNQIKRAGKWLTRFYEKIENQLDTINENIEFLENNSEDTEALEQELSTYKKEKNSLSATIKSVKNKRDELFEIIKKLKENQAKLTEVEKNVNQYYLEIAEREPVISQLTQTVDSDFSQLSKENISDLKLQEVKSSLNKELNELNAKLEPVEKDIQTYQQLKDLELTKQDSVSALNTQINKVKTDLGELLGEQSIEVLEQHLKELRNQISFEEEKITNFQLKLDLTANKYETQKATLEQLKTKINQFTDNFNNSFGHPLEKLATIKQEIKERGKLLENQHEDLSSQFETLNAGISKLEGEKSILHKTLELVKSTVKNPSCPVCNKEFTEDDSQEMIETHSNRLNTINEKQDKLREKKSKVQQELNQTVQELDTSKEDWKGILNYEKEMATYQKWKKEYKSLQETLVETEKQLRKDQNELKKVKDSNITEVKEQESRIAGKLEKISENNNQLTVLEDKHKMLIDEIAAIEKQLKKLDEAKLSKTKDGLINSKKAVDEKLTLINDKLIPNFTKLENERKELNNAQKKLEETNSILKSLQEKFDKDSLEDNNAKYKKIQEEYSDLVGESRSLDTKIEGIKTRINNVEDAANKLKSLRANKKKLEQLSPTIKHVNSTVNNAPGLLIEKTATEISTYLTNMVKRLLPGRGYQKAVFQGDANVNLYQQGQQIDQATLSGGEKTVLSLALRMALADYVAPMKFLILDEPTIHLDQQRIEEFLDIIDQGHLFQKSQGQLILVTHREEFERNAQHSIQIKLTGQMREVL